MLNTVCANAQIYLLRKAIGFESFRYAWVLLSKSSAFAPGRRTKDGLRVASQSVWFYEDEASNYSHPMNMLNQR